MKYILAIKLFKNSFKFLLKFSGFILGALRLAVCFVKILLAGNFISDRSANFCLRFWCR